MTTANLRDNLADEKAKADRLAERLHQRRIGCEKAERLLDKLQTELRSEAAQAALAEKEYAPSAETRKKLAQTQNDVAHAQADIEALGQALGLQHSRVGELEAMLQASKHEEFVAVARPIADAINTTIPQFSELAFKLQCLAQEHGQDYHAMMGLLFPGLKLGQFSGNDYFNRCSALILAAGALPTAGWAKRAAMGE